MATVQEPTKTPVRTKHDAAVEAHLRQAEQRIRFLDVTVALLGWVLGTLGFAVVMVALDRWLELSSLVRQLTFAAFLFASGVYLTFALFLPLWRRINPYYAARQLEQSL